MLYFWTQCLSRIYASTSFNVTSKKIQASHYPSCWISLPRQVRARTTALRLSLGSKMGIWNWTKSLQNESTYGRIRQDRNEAVKAKPQGGGGLCRISNLSFWNSLSMPGEGLLETLTDQEVRLEGSENIWPPDNSCHVLFLALIPKSSGMNFVIRYKRMCSEWVTCLIYFHHVCMGFILFFLLLYYRVWILCFLFNCNLPINTHIYL